MVTPSKLVYTTTFKLFNVVMTSKYVELAKDAWIEAKPEFKGNPSRFLTFLPYFLMALPHSEFGLSKFYQSLLDSEVTIGSRHTEEDGENNPFDLHDCAYIAIAISILTDYWFVAGIGTFSNNKTSDQPTIEPWTSFFWGKKNGQATITSYDEQRLKEIYNFVFQSLRYSSRDKDKEKLLFYYLRCIVPSSSQGFVALKMGMPSLLNERTTIIVNAALFFENVFTQKTRGVLKGVDVWNKSSMSTVLIDPVDVSIVLGYRHTLVHFNATDAEGNIGKWKKQNNFTDEEAFNKVEEMAISNVKNIMRIIVENYNNYELYRTKL